MELSSTHIRCSVQIDLCALERNLGNLRHKLGGKRRCMALVSADAFGFGVEASAVRLMLSGADAFAVSNVSEGQTVSAIASGWPIVVLASSLPSEEDFYFQSNLRPTLVSLEEVERFETAAKKFSTKLKVHLRVPVCDEMQSVPNSQDAFKMLERICKSEYLNLEALCLHGMGSGAPTDTAKPDMDFLNKAAEFFIKTKQTVFIHHSDIFNPESLPKYFESCFRAGLILFGISPHQDSVLRGFKPDQVMTFRGAVSQVKFLPKGATVGYSKTYTLQRDSKIALLSIGYGDGLPRKAGKSGQVLINGSRLPIIGIVSMDQAAVDATDLEDVKVGDEVILIGQDGKEEITIEDYCVNMGISPAEALTSITKRVPRYYKTLY